MIGRILFRIALFIGRLPKWFVVSSLIAVVFLPFAGIAITKIYQFADDAADRGAVGIADSGFGDTYTTPEYLDQGWEPEDSLWFYNTTQGSAFMPYDFFLALEQAEIDGTKKVECAKNGIEAALFICDENIDRLRYLPQHETLFNPHALPVGFVKETYKGRDYIGYTCAACHTGQVNFEGRALRIDGGPAMADMVGFMAELTKAMQQTERDPKGDNPRLDRFVERVINMNNDFDDRAEIEQELARWTDKRELYNAVNRSTYYDPEANKTHRVHYGYARLDAFGRIYNRVLQHAISRAQVAEQLRLVTDRNSATEPMMSEAQIEKVLHDVGDEIILRDDEFAKIIANLRNPDTAAGYPALNLRQILRVRNRIFNSPNAPVSYPFLWDIPHSDYVQWNSIAGNAGPGPLGRNAGEVTGVFGILDWHEEKGIWGWFKKFSISALASGQTTKKKVINFESSIDLFNLQRLESHLATLQSPRWPFCRSSDTGDYYLPTGPDTVSFAERQCEGDDVKTNKDMVDKGRLIYARNCQSCHDVIDRSDWDRLVIGKLVSIEDPESTDIAMAHNSAFYAGKPGNFRDTYQAVDGVGTVVVGDNAPVAQILTATTKGVVATPDPDKWWPRRIAEWVYSLVMTIADNPIKNSVKAGNCKPDTTAQPFNSIQAYRARSLNGIWATAPYLHNGSVPDLYNLLLPVDPMVEQCRIGKKDTNGEFIMRGWETLGMPQPAQRVTSFRVGSREFEPDKVGFRSDGDEGFEFRTDIRGNFNVGHEYGACGMTDVDRYNLIEYLKSL